MAGADGAPRVLFCVSAHGFGHATRVAAVLSALRRRGGDRVGLFVRGASPTWIYTRRVPDVEFTHAVLDVGVLQRGGLDLDLPATLEAHEAHVAAWSEQVEREARALAALAPALVVADVPPLAVEAAARAGIPVVALANFGWDWVLDPEATGEPRFGPIASRYAEAYARAETLLRLPLHGAFPTFREVRDVPFVCHRATPSREESRRALGLGPDGDPAVLVSFGGFGVGPDGRGAADPGPYHFFGFGPAPAGFRGRWTELPTPSPLPHEELVNACDALLGKPGFGTVAEVLAHHRPFLYVPRRDFRECPVLERGLEDLGWARPLAREDFDAGRWRPDLEALLAGPRGGGAVRCDGAEVVADWILARLDLL